MPSDNQFLPPPDNQSSYEFKFTLNVTPSDYPSNSILPIDDAPIVPAGDGLLTAPDGSTLTPYSVLELSEKSATTQRRQRKRTHDRGGDYVPRPPNPFILFRCWYTAKVHKPGSHDSTEGSLSRLCGQEWQNLGVTQRRIFEEAAKIEKVKHAERYPNYRYKPIHKKGKKAAAAAAAAAAIATASPSTYHQVADDEDYLPPDHSHRYHRPMPLALTGSTSGLWNSSVVSTPPLKYPIPQLPNMHAALARHRRSSSVPLPGDMDAMEQAMRPIEIPTAPFLALAGHDLPPRRSRGNSLGLSHFAFPRPSQTLQNWSFPEHNEPLYNYTAMRTSIAAVQSTPASPSGRRAMLHDLNTPYAFTPQEHFYNSFAEPSSEVKWTNPNPFASSQSSSSDHDAPPASSPLQSYVQTVFLDSSSSSSSAPSPPADLEISPLERRQVPVQVATADGMHIRRPTSVNLNESTHSTLQLPFDTAVFKTPHAGEVDFGMGLHHDFGRPRGLSILEGDSLDMNILSSGDYMHALQTEGYVGEIPAHEHLMHQYIHGSSPGP